jgi:3'-phosphoadenosine 5'-phosphosulfate sulfotransferase (PAPS reductase)/FAD synthetase
MEVKYLIVAQSYDKQINPIEQEYIDKNGKTKKKFVQTRADKETRYAHYKLNKTATLAEKERWSIELIKMSLQRAKKPVISCSFGIDSVLDIYLTRKALVELGRDPSDIDIVWNDTANEFQEVRKYQRHLTELWNLRLVITKPKRTLKHIIEKNGGITSDYFTARKGDRRNGRPLSEKCCGTLKHDPMKKITKEQKWDLLIVGLRGDESRQRMQAGLRDGEFFYSSGEWKALVCRPILWWNEKDVWDYVYQEQIPYNELYTKNLIMEYPKKLNEVIDKNLADLIDVDIDIEALRSEQIQTVNRLQAVVLEKLKFKMFTPRTGCMMCPIPVKYGYMQWMRLYYPKVADAMLYNLGYANALLKMLPQEVKDEIKTFTGIDPDAQDAIKYLADMLSAKPCTFDKF